MLIGRVAPLHEGLLPVIVFFWVIIFWCWPAKRQHTISRSSAEAEYRDVANVVTETAWLRNLLRKLYSPLSTATLIYCDNVSAVYMSANPVQYQQTKHIKIDIHFVRDMVTTGQGLSVIMVKKIVSFFGFVDVDLEERFLCDVDWICFWVKEIHVVKEI
nr:ribonuclease H-like domain-containing protein [Tanacetum cinerariifolium]